MRNIGSWGCYFGKVDETFDYPYTVEVIYNLNNEESRTGTITFHNASSCSASYYGYGCSYGSCRWVDATSTFTK